MFKRLYDKSQIWFAVLWIVAYCVLLSAADSASSAIGIEKSVTLPVGALMSFVLIMFLKRHGLFSEYGICRSSASARSMLFYLPLLIMLTANLWHGTSQSLGIAETALYIGSMFCVGFLEEVIFRGLLFGAMRKDSQTAAVIVSSLTFGIGHIINLVNGSGAELIPNLLQVVYATAAGFMFVMIYLKTESLIVCIVTHGLFNALSVFANDAQTMKMRIASALLLTVITGSYAAYIAFTMRRKPKHTPKE